MLTCFVSLLLISFYGVQVECKVESYSLGILEKGTLVREVVEVDVDNQTEVFYVPQHNDVAAMDMMNDFKVGLTVRRIPSTQDCYVSKLDSSLPVPKKMRINMEQVPAHSLRNLQVTTKRNNWRVTGPADRLALPQTFLDFCDSFPIYIIEKTSVDSVISSFQEGHGRRKRNHIVTDFSACGPEGVKAMVKCLGQQNYLKRTKNQHVQYNMKCSYKTHSCFYVVDCKPIGGGSYECDKKAHFIDFLGLCCYPIC